VLAAVNVIELSYVVGLGENAAASPAGMPEALIVTLPPKPFIALM
jgi:hypothetical protein